MTSTSPDIVTERLRLRRFDPASDADCSFVLELLNQRSFIDAIADRGVRNADDAARFLRDGPLASYPLGFGMHAIERRADGVSVGMCGLLKRDYLEHPDLGYALLDRHAGNGYAFEAASATLAQAWQRHRIARIVATTALDNAASVRVLERLGFRCEGLVHLPVHAGPSRYFVLDVPDAPRSG